MITKITKYKRDWLYKESVLDVYEEMGIELENESDVPYEDSIYMKYYDNLIRRIKPVRDKDKENYL